MRNRAVLALSAALFLGAFFGASSGLWGYAKKKNAAEAREFLKQLPDDQKILQALNRLTFGPRPGDAQEVKAMGLKKWIDRQLHPAQIEENPELTKRLQYLDTLAMPSAEMIRNYPTPQMARQMVNGQIPFPTDPDRKLVVTRMVERYEKRQAQGGDAISPPNPNLPDTKALNELLSPQQMRSLRQGTPEQRVAAFLALGKDIQD